MPVVKTKGGASSQGFGEFAPKGGAVNYIDDVFSTYLYTGNGSTQTITNGIDLSTKGGMVWLKSRSAATDNFLFDTARGATKELNSNKTDAEATLANSLTAFNANGFSISSATGIGVNAATYASWTFRKQKKFFDVVTYTGTGSNTTIAHNLGSVPGCIIVKRTDTTADWQVYHRSLANTEYMVLNATAAKATGATRWNSTTPTSSVFSLGTDTTVNASGGTYVAYLFAHDAGGFGTSGTDNVISCGSFTTDGSGNFNVNLGYEPQFVLIKSTDFIDSWYLIDVMRGMSQTTTNTLKPNTSGAESAHTSGYCFPTATGFTGVPGLFTASQSFIYIAIRRPMKPPTTGTSVFNMGYGTGTGPAASVPHYSSSTSIVDGAIFKSTTGTNPTEASRLTGATYLLTNTTDAEATYTYGKFDYQNGFSSYTSSQPTYLAWMFQRASGFFDEVCYTGDGTVGQRAITHNLGVVPELIITKPRNNAGNWYGTAAGLTNPNNYYIALNSNAAEGDYGGPFINQRTSTSFSVNTIINNNTYTYVAYLFATVAGVSKVGSYTGTGTVTQTINAGFGASGARFVLIKRTDSTGNWYVFDTTRGFTSTSSPYTLLNSAAAEVTGNNGCYAASTGFTLDTNASATVNINGASYIYLAIS